jgi:hypothetical protein
MISLLSGIVLMGASAGIFWVVRPVEGHPHRLATMPMLETAIPLAITTGIVLGFALMVAGVIALVGT